jgi:uncharacterized membrane protein YphA (DoxX/SURF4 family)
MHPLSVFPELLTFGLVAPALLRLTVGILRLFAGFYRYKKSYGWVSVFHIVSSVLLIIGLYTQIVALIALACVVFDYYMEKKDHSHSGEKLVISILFGVILLSLLFTGPGFLSFDLPL